MRVCFDAYWWDGGPPSGKNVLRSICSAWQREFPDDQILLVTSASARDLPHGCELYRPKLKPHALVNMLEIASVSRRCDALVTQNFSPLWSSGPTVTYMHDLIFTRHPEWFTLKERLYLRLMLVSLERRSSRRRIVTSTAAEGKQIAKTRAAGGKVVPVGLGLPESFSVATARRPAGVGDGEKFYLTVGRLNIRKNVSALAEELLANPEVYGRTPLVVAGGEDGKSPHFGSLSEYVESGMLRFLGHVTDAELKWLYGNCTRFIFPSLDEGFGLPILEAWSTHCAMALSDIASFREVAPDTATFFDPKTFEGLGDALTSALSSLGPIPECYTWRRVVLLMRAELTEAKV